MTKETTQKIKGVAILIMIAHHFLVYDAGISFSAAWRDIGNAFKICVGIYAVLSGYGYYFAKEKSIQYGMKKIWGLLQEYWIQLFTIFVPCALLGGWKLTIDGVIVNLFALGPNLNWNAWYVHFFIFCMLVMPTVSRVFRFHPIINIGLAVGVPFLFEVAIHVLIPNYQDITMLQVLFNCMLYFGVFLVGYLMAQYDIVGKCKIHWVLGLLCMVVAIGLRIALRHVYTFGFNMDAIYAPIFIIGAANLFNGFKGKWTYIFSVLGKYSTGMWFIHAAFFATYVKDYFQPALRIVRQPALMYVWLVAMSLGLAFVYRELLDGIHNVVHLWKGRT